MIMITGNDDHDPPETMITIKRNQRSQSTGIRNLSTTQRRGSKTKPRLASGSLTTSRVMPSAVAAFAAVSLV